jgi:three-Cys-motif partner protein
MTADNSFFEESTEQSRLKAVIVSKYFRAWANVIVPQVKNTAKKVGYIDLFAGTGRYKDGTKSTPLLVLERAVADSDLQQMLVSIFTDKDLKNCAELETAINAIPGIEALKYPPKVDQIEVGDEIIKMFSNMTMIPSLIFLDPWGYKGLCLDLVNAVVKDWACDCILFFNYLRVNMALENPKFADHVDALFGKARAARLREQIVRMEPIPRELLVLNELVEALKEVHGKYVMKFRFLSPEKDRVSHYLILVTKHLLGYDIMKAIMAKASTSNEQGVPTFEHNPSLAKESQLVFDLCRPLDCLERDLPKIFADQTLSMLDVYNLHNVGTRYIKKNYKIVLLKLERAGQLTADPPYSKRKKDTFADDVRVFFHY